MSETHFSCCFHTRQVLKIDILCILEITINIKKTYFVYSFKHIKCEKFESLKKQFRACFDLSPSVCNPRLLPLAYGVAVSNLGRVRTRDEI